MKGPPTEEDLLQIGNSTSLHKITYLNLSRRKLGTVDSQIFNKLERIQSLDLSQNCLTQISADLRLPTLHTLDLSDNQLQSIDFVQNFEKLEQLYLEDNDTLTMDDYYIAKVLCPSLRSIDGAEDVKHIEKGVQLYTSQLEPQIEAVWEARFSEVYSRGVDQDEMKSLHEEFVRTINQGNVVGSNLTMPKFRHFMIRHLCWQLIEEVNQGRQKSKRRSIKSSDGTNTPSQYGTRVSKGVTPVKHYSSGVPVSDSEQKDASSHTDKKKRKREVTSDSSPAKFQSAKRKREVTPDESPVKASSSKRKREDTPDRSPVKATSANWKKGDSSAKSPVKSPAAKRTKVDTKTPDFTKLKKDGGTEISQLLSEYEPLLFLRCHSKGNNPADHTTKVWNCAFEPLIGNPGETSNILASCGGHNICFIDCQTGKVMKRYKDASKSESFYALAWTTLKADVKHLKDDVNILAVGGQDAVIKLIHPTQLVMFGTLKGHKGYISSLIFHPSRPNILFSGSKDGRIIMWEIGVPDFKDFSIKWSQKAVLTLPKTDTICLAVNAELDVLVAGCEESCYGWKLKKLYKNEKNINVGPDFEFVHPRVDDDDDEPIVVDGLAVLSNNCIVSKCVDQDRLYLWDLEPHTDDGFKGPKPYRILVSPLAELQYIRTAIDYLYLNSCKDLLSVGDDKGNIYMYNLKTVVRKKKACDELLQPSLTLEYPDVNIHNDFEETMSDVSEKKEVVINCIGQSSSGEYLVCGTDNNLICMWKASG